MSRLTLGGRKRAGGKIHEHRRQSEHEHENVDKQREDLRRTVDEYHDGSHCPLNVILPQAVYVSCSIKAGAVGFALYRCPFSCSCSSCSRPEILSFQIVI